MIAKHFPADVQRGIITNCFTKLEEVEEFLLKVDDTYKYDSRQETKNYVDNPRRGYSNAGPSRDFGAPITRNQNNNSNQNSNVCSITSFNQDTENLSTDLDSEAKEKEIVSPTLKIRVGEQEIETLLDSGSDVCAVSERFFDSLKGKVPNIPILPVSNLSIAVAVGGKTQRVKNQVLLPIEIAEFDIDVICLVIPDLNCNVLLGSNWLFKGKAVIDFDKSTLCFRSGENLHTIDIVSKLNSNIHIYLCKNEVDNVYSELLDKKENNVIKHAYTVVDFESAVSQACTEDSNKPNLLNISVGNRSVLSECLDPGQENCYVHEMELNDESVFNAPSDSILFIYRNSIVPPDMKLTFYIQSDSSDYALGGSLYQMSNEEEREVVAYTSSTSNEGQLTYPDLKSEA
ncbi:hypothetical protein JTB14_003860 [Gonioctena quinquepunctata]|nr:hypothetical protein JTB14_003860 [Gonioctena quinquepunctata]